MPRATAQIYRRRRIAVAAAALLVLGTGFYLPLTLLAPVQALSASVEPIEVPAPVEPPVTFPDYGASGVGAIGYPGVLASAGSTDPLPIASISKVITALVVLQAKPLTAEQDGPTLTFGETDRQFYEDQLADGGSVAEVYVGQSMSQRTALEVMLIRSANNYAQSLAQWAFGSQAAFVDAARAWLAQQGLSGTTIAEPSGVDPANRSTVSDLIEIGRRVIQDPVLATIVSTASLDVPDLGTIENSNGLLGVDGIDGIKTGTLDEAGSCLLFSQDRTIGSQTVTIVGVVLGGPDHDTINAAIRSLLAEVDAGFREVTLATAGEPFASYSTPWGDTASAVAASDLSAVVWAATPISLSVQAQPIRLAEAGSAVGQAAFTVGDRELVVPLTLAQTVDDPGPWWRLTNPAELF